MVGKKDKAAMRKIKTIASCKVRDIARKFTSAQQQKYKELFIILNKILLQEKAGKNKAYSIHEPEVSCIAKGKKGQEV